MIIADTSVWVTHFRAGLVDFAAALGSGLISMHPVVLGELIMGNLANRKRTVASLRSLPQTKNGTLTECLEFVETYALFGRGIGWNDLQLLVAARLSGNLLWTLDRRLAVAATELGVNYLSP